MTSRLYTLKLKKKKPFRLQSENNFTKAK